MAKVKMTSTPTLSRGESKRIVREALIIPSEASKEHLRRLLMIRKSIQATDKVVGRI